MSRAEQVARILLGRKAVSLNISEPFTYASGIKSPIYCDNRILISCPTERDFVVDAFISMIEDNNIVCDVLAGTATAGIPWAAFIAQKMGKPMVYVKKVKKEYGQQKKIEGTIQEGQQVVIVEDLISTGGSSLTALESVREAGGTVTDVIAIFTYEMKKASDGFVASNCSLHTLCGLSDLVDVALKDNQITEEDKNAVLEWSRDPEGWGK